MKKILTAIGNPIFNKKLKEMEDYEVLTKDITNDEELIEWLEREEEIAFLFLCSKIIKHYKVDEFIKIIRKLQEDIVVVLFQTEELQTSLKEDDNLKICTSLEVHWEFFENILQKAMRKDIQKSTSKIIAISGASGVREKYFFCISC